MLLEKSFHGRTTLQNKVVMVTGGGGGIGLEASRAFLCLGAKVIIAEIDAEKCLYVSQLLQEEFTDDNSDVYQIDVTDEQQVDRLLE